MKSFDSEIVSGSVLRSVWKLSWPVALTQVISGVHGFVDQVLVGHYVGHEGNAGVGVAWQLFLVILVFVSSLFHGMSIVIARYAGRRDADSVSRVAYAVLIAATYALVFFVAPVGYFLAPQMLEWARVAPDVMPHALPYLRISFTASAPLFFMFIIAGAFNSVGDARTPLKLAALSTVTNVLLSYLLIAGPGPMPSLGTAGAAIGTCLGPLPSLAIAVWFILARRSVIAPPPRYTLVPDMTVIRTVVRLGVPAGVQAVLLNLGGAVLFAFIGTLDRSAAAQAAFALCYGQLFSFVTWTGFGLRAAAATVVGQNLGAGNEARAVRSVYVTAMLGFIWSVLFGIAFWTIPAQLLGIFGAAEGPVLEIGSNLLRFLGPSGVFVVLALAFTGGLQGAGDTKRPMVIAFITQIIVLLGICAWYASRDALTATTIWTAILIAHTLRLVLSYAAFHQGKWRGISVEFSD